MSLEDRQAPYKGIWLLHESNLHQYVALHCTYLDPCGLACVIEHLHFPVRTIATDFARHLIRHGWSVRDLQKKAEHFWYGLPDHSIADVAC